MLLLGLVEVPTTLIIITVLTVLLNVYLTWDHGYWKSQGVAGPTPYPIVGTFHTAFKHGFTLGQQEMYEKYKKNKVIGTYEGSKPTLTIVDPELLKTIFVKDFHHFTNRRSAKGFSRGIMEKIVGSLEDEDWRRVRSALTPAFSSGKLKRMMPELNRTTDILLEKLEEKADKGESFGIKKPISAWANDMIAGTVFGFRSDAMNNENDIFLQKIEAIMKLSWIKLSAIICTFLIPPTKYLLVPFGIFEFPGQDFFTNIVDQSLKNYSSKESAHNDILKIVANAEKVHDDTQSNKDVKGLDHDEIVANMIGLYLGGTDNVATGIMWLLYELAVNPDIQEKLYQEVYEAIADQEEVTYAMLEKLPYMDMCMGESLRKYPLAVQNERRCREDITIDGIRIRKDMMVSFPTYSIHRDPDIYPEPDKFNPNRFTPEEKAMRNPYHYQPWGHGPRNCVGMRMAQLEMKAAIAKILQHFRVCTTEETEIPATLQKSGRMWPAKEILLKVERRH